ncbi:MAG: hypothetical protein AB7S26_24420 [Sandaracinaceae bacterium]
MSACVSAPITRTSESPASHTAAAAPRATVGTMLRDDPAPTPRGGGHHHHHGAGAERE